MTQRQFLLVMALVSSGIACRPSIRPGLKVVGSPTGTISGVPRINAVFDRPMVAREKIGALLTSGPLRVKPAIEGELRWLDVRTLALIPAQHVPGGNRFDVEIPRGTVALDGTGLVEPVRWSFDTGHLELEATLRSSAPGIDPGRWATRDQAAELKFNLPVLAAEVGNRCSYASAKRRIAAQPDRGDEDPRPQFVVTPAAPLDADTEWTLSCDAALLPADGKLGLPSGDSSAKVTFRTFGPFVVKEVRPAGEQVDIDRAELVIELSNPPAEGGTKLPLSITPALEGFPERAEIDGARVRFDARNLQPYTEYTVEVAAGMIDRFGQKLAAAHRARFKTGGAQPKLDVNTGVWVVEAARSSYPIWARNLTHVDVDAAAVSEAALLRLLPELEWWDDQSVDLAKLKLAHTERSLPVKGRENHWEQVPLEPKQLLGGRTPATGFFYFALRAPEEPKPEYGNKRVREVLVNFTNLGVTSKLAGPSGLVWVTRLDSGEPVAGADVTMRTREGKVKWRGKTGNDGIARTPGLGALVPPQPKVDVEAEHFEEDGEDWEGEDTPATAARRARRGLLVFVRSGDDFTYVDPFAEGGLAAWNFNVPASNSNDKQQLRGFMHSDRGLYRPGDTVHLRGLARVMRLGEGLRIPDARKVKLEVTDPRGEKVVARTAGLSQFGGFNFDVPIGGDARLGDYRVVARLAGGEFRETFTVEEYRPATFEVKLRTEQQHPVVGDLLTLETDAHYLYGAALRSGKIAWSVHARPRTPSFPEHAGYSFRDDSIWDDWSDGSRSGEDLVTEHEGKLDGQGRGRWRLRLDRDRVKGDRDLMVTAEVSDETNRSIAANLVVPVQTAGVALGLKLQGAMAAAGKPMRASVIAVDSTGHRVAAQANLRLVKQTWSCGWEAWGYRGSYRCERHEDDIEKRTVVVDAERPADLVLTPPTSGEYLLALETKDPRGNRTVTATHVWTWGDGEPPWRADDSARFPIVADRAKYRPGDTARLLLKTPVKDARALITIEREGVLEERTVVLTSTADALEIPIKEAYAPNVYVSVVLVKGRSGPGARGLPSLRMGVVGLAVETEQKRLSVKVSPEREGYRPGETVKATVRVQDADGKPVRAEVSLAAADEGVLSLIAFKTPDPLATFYAPWALGVTSASQYERLAHLPEPGQERYATGGDGAGRPGTLRARMMATAYWNPRLETDDAGIATVSFVAPDNLTAYRLMAVAADAGDRFGSGDVRFTVSKPLQLLAAMPRFLLVGDQAQSGVMITNETGKEGDAAVEVGIIGAKLNGPSRRTVHLAAGARAEVSFPVVVDAPGEIRMQFRAQLGAEKDGLEVRLPASHPAPWETQLIAEGDTAGAADVPLVLPTGMLPASGTLEISVDPDGLAGIEESLRDLIEYPYGCLEQTTSRLIPLVAGQEMARSLGLAQLDGPKLQSFIKAGIAKLGRFQAESGGFSLWENGKPETYLTAFALWGLKQAADAGFNVSRRRLRDGERYLRAALAQGGDLAAGVHSELGEMGSRAFAVWVLGQLGHPDGGYAQKLLDSKQKLPNFGTAFLARALGDTLGRQHVVVAGLLDELLLKARTNGDRKLVGETSSDLRWYMSDDLRTSAIVTDAVLDLRPEEPALPALVRGLLGERVDGRWRNTQDNLYALVTLARYLKSRPLLPAATEVTLGGKRVLAAALDQGAVRIKHASVAVPPAGGTLNVKATRGHIHYAVRMRFRREVSAQKAVENGFRIRREIVDATTGKPVDGAVLGHMVKVRVTVSTDSAPIHVAVVDRLPAGLEVLNSRFVTTAAAADSAESHDEDWTWYQHREVRDDRVQVFAEQLSSGSYVFEYLARPTTAGTFALPPATVEQMYAPEQQARTVPAVFVVKAK